MGEILALTVEEIGLENKVKRITKSYQRLKRSDVITDPKTPKSKRTMSMPDFLCEELREYVARLYGILPTMEYFIRPNAFYIMK